MTTPFSSAAKPAPKFNGGFRAPSFGVLKEQEDTPEVPIVEVTPEGEAEKEPVPVATPKRKRRSPARAKVEPEETAEVVSPIDSSPTPRVDTPTAESPAETLIVGVINGNPPRQAISELRSIQQRIEEVIAKTESFLDGIAASK